MVGNKNVMPSCTNPSLQYPPPSQKKTRKFNTPHPPVNFHHISVHTFLPCIKEINDYIAYMDHSYLATTSNDYLDKNCICVFNSCKSFLSWLYLIRNIGYITKMMSNQDIR